MRTEHSGSILRAINTHTYYTCTISFENTAATTAESALKSFLSGGVGGICVVLVGHPLDLIKVRMQTAAVSTTQQSVMGMFADTFRTQGIRGLYRGVSAPLIAVTPVFALSFWGYDVGQRLVSWSSGDTDLSLGQKCIAGGLSAIPCTVLLAPSERIKCLLQTSAPGKYKGSFDCAKTVLQSGGIRSLYRGTLLTLMRDIPGSVAWFGMYEFVKKSIMQAQGIHDTKQLSPIAVLTAGGLAGVANWTIAIPPDVLKSRLQSAPDGTYRGIADVYRTLIEKEGYSALFAGLRPAMIRAFPANAACFMGMELARKMLDFMD
jgi:solute carrier family 25 carnitine/acylcarnitine transporter 20/29